MAHIVFNHVRGKPPMFDGTTSFDQWKRKMKMHLGTIHTKVWNVTENDFIVLDPDNLTDKDEINQ